MTISFCSFLILSALSLSFLSVPLYRIFCQKTGYGGTPIINTDGNYLRFSNNGKRSFKIKFNADSHRSLPCSFFPLQKEMVVKTGELGLAFYRIRNEAEYPVRGVATYNVTPDKVGSYFHKVECFCFEEQKFNGKQTVDLPVQFYLDQGIEKDHIADDVKTITLSYTFFRLKERL